MLAVQYLLWLLAGPPHTLALRRTTGYKLLSMGFLCLPLLELVCFSVGLMWPGTCDLRRLACATQSHTKAVIAVNEDDVNPPSGFGEGEDA